MKTSTLPALTARILGTGGIALLLGACASEPANQLASNESGENVVMVCEDVEVTGSRFTKRVCGTEEQWDDTKKAQRQAVESLGQDHRENAARLEQGAGGVQNGVL